MAKTYRERCIDLLNGYCEQYMFEPELWWPKEEFRERSYSRWAAFTILSKIKETSFDPVLICEGFINNMRRFSEIREERDQSMFSIAEDTAWILKDLFIKERRKTNGKRQIC